MWSQPSALLPQEADPQLHLRLPGRRVVVADLAIGRGGSSGDENEGGGVRSSPTSLPPAALPPSPTPSARVTDLSSPAGS